MPLFEFGDVVTSMISESICFLQKVKQFSAHLPFYPTSSNWWFINQESDEFLLTQIYCGPKNMVFVKIVPPFLCQLGTYDWFFQSLSWPFSRIGKVMQLEMIQKWQITMSDGSKTLNSIEDVINWKWKGIGHLSNLL